MEASRQLEVWSADRHFSSSIGFRRKLIPGGVEVVFLSLDTNTPTKDTTFYEVFPVNGTGDNAIWAALFFLYFRQACADEKSPTNARVPLRCHGGEGRRIVGGHKIGC